MTGISGGSWLVLTVVILLAALAACAGIHFIRKKEQNNSLIRMILEEEFGEYKSAEQKSEAATETVSVPETEGEATEAIVDSIPEAEETVEESKAEIDSTK